jgi:hypothetical protein
MRCLFTFFAEDVGLLPKDCFTALLSRLREEGRITACPDMAGSLWATMKTGGFSPILMQSVVRFNGGLFDQATASPRSWEHWTCAGRFGLIYIILARQEKAGTHQEKAGTHAWHRHFELCHLHLNAL